VTGKLTVPVSGPLVVEDMAYNTRVMKILYRGWFKVIDYRKSAVNSNASAKDESGSANLLHHLHHFSLPEGLLRGAPVGSYLLERTNTQTILWRISEGEPEADAVAPAELYPWLLPMEPV
jgi:hypothetical protein